MTAIIKRRSLTSHDKDRTFSYEISLKLFFRFAKVKALGLTAAAVIGAAQRTSTVPHASPRGTVPAPDPGTGTGAPSAGTAPAGSGFTAREHHVPGNMQENIDFPGGMLERAVRHPV